MDKRNTSYPMRVFTLQYIMAGVYTLYIVFLIILDGFCHSFVASNF